MKCSFLINSLPLLGVLILSQATSAATVCSDQVMAELREKATEEKKAIRIQCNPTLNERDVVTKQVIIDSAKANGVIFDCDGATISRAGDSIAIRSRRIVDAQGNVSWSRPENVTVRNCEIKGAIRISGMDTNGNGEGNEGALKISSRLDDKHTARAQAAAPTNILLEKITIIGQGRIPLYVSPGVTRLTLRNSVLKGNGSSVAIYLDAESAFNVIQNNKIQVDTEKREVIAIDGSRGNLIIGNYISGLSNGGIYIYRNCGEGGSIRHQKPTENQIINNTFYYKEYNGGKPSVWAGSRNGDSYYCDHDKGFPFGSSASDKDYAIDNVIADNQIYVLDVNKMIRFGDSPNKSINNKTVRDATKSASSCYIAQDGSLLRSGGKKLVELRSNGPRTCAEVTCNDGLQSSSIQACSVIVRPPTEPEESDEQLVNFECSQRNEGSCRKSVSCPSGYVILDARAACNLETDFVNEAAVNRTIWNTISISRTSDRVSDGRCEFPGVSLSEGVKNLNLRGLTKVDMSCEERRDDNSSDGDCEIRGQLRCVRR